MGRNFTTVDAMWLNAIESCFAGHMTSTTSECIGWHGVLTSLDYTFLSNSRRKLSRQYAAAETIWYMSGDDDVSMLLKYAPQYEKFAEDNGKAFGSYGFRLRHNSVMPQIDLALDILSNQKDSRQCVLTLWHPDDLWHASQVKNKPRDLPCTCCWQLIRRDKTLHMICTMRSNDVWLGMPYDIFANTCFLRLFAGTLMLTPGTYTHQAGSMHIYHKDRQKCVEAVHAGYHTLRHHWDDRSTFDEVPKILQFEQEWPEEQTCEPRTPLSQMSIDLVYAVHDEDPPYSPLLRSAKKC